MVTGVAYYSNRDEIDKLKDRVNKIENLLRNTCSKVRRDNLSLLYSKAPLFIAVLDDIIPRAQSLARKK